MHHETGGKLEIKNSLSNIWRSYLVYIVRWMFVMFSKWKCWVWRSKLHFSFMCENFYLCLYLGGHFILWYFWSYNTEFYAEGYRLSWQAWLPKQVRSLVTSSQGKHEANDIYIISQLCPNRILYYCFQRPFPFADTVPDDENARSVFRRVLFWPLAKDMKAYGDLLEAPHPGRKETRHFVPKHAIYGWMLFFPYRLARHFERFVGRTHLFICLT